MNPPLHIEDIEAGMAKGCRAPHCDHTDHGPMTESYFHGNCHPHAGVDACYKLGSGILEISCRECQRPIANLALASGEVEAALRELTFCASNCPPLVDTKDRAAAARRLALAISAAEKLL